MTASIFSDWLTKHCIPDARMKSRQLDQDFKMLLLMDNAPAHPTWVQDLVPRQCKIVFMPPRTTSLIQPLDQELISTVKQIYHRNVYDYLREQTETNEELYAMEELTTDEDSEESAPLPSPATPRPSPAAALAAGSSSPDPDSPPPPLALASATPPHRSAPETSVIKFWKRFTVKDGVDFLLKSWEEINFATINHAWRRLLPHLCVPTGSAAIQPLSEAEAATLQAAQSVPGLQDLTLQDIQEAHSVEPKQDQLEVQLRVDEADQLMETRGGEDMQNNQPTGGEEALSMRKISNILLAVERLKEELQDHETCRQRSDEIIFGLDKLFRYYTEKHREEVNRRQQTDHCILSSECASC